MGGGQEGGLDADHHQEVERFTQTERSYPDSFYEDGLDVHVYIFRRI